MPKSPRLILPKLLFTACCLWAVAFLCARPSFAEAETLDRILVVVNDEIITESDLANAMKPVVAQFRATLSGDALNQKIDEATDFFLKKLVDDQLLVSAAKRQKVAVEESEVDEMVDDIRKKFPSPEQFQKILREQGISFKSLREKFRKEILKKKIIDFKVRSRVNVSPGDIHDYYQAHPDEFVKPPRIELRQILIRIGEKYTEPQAQELANSLYEKLKAGESFETLAKNFSDGANAAEGGYMGWVDKGQFKGEIDKALFGLTPPDVTAPIKTQLGFHLFRVEAKSEGDTLALEEVQKELGGFLFKKKTDEQLEKYLEELRKDAYIAYQ